MITGAEWLAGTLAANRVTHVFFASDVLQRTLTELGTQGVACVRSHTESAAAAMADGYARIAGRPALCFAPAAGVAELLAALREAYRAGSPVIALTGRCVSTDGHRNVRQAGAAALPCADASKFAAEVAAAAELPRLLRQAWQAALSSSPRPAHLALDGPQAASIEQGPVSEPPRTDATLQMRLPPYRPVPAEREIALAAKASRTVTRMAIIAGAGAVASGAGPELLALAEALSAPVGTSLDGHGLIPTGHRLAIGCVGATSAPPANRVVAEAELVLFVGCHADERVTHGRAIPTPDTTVIQIDIDPAELGRNHPQAIGLMGDPKATLAQLFDAVDHPARDTAFADRAADLVGAWREERAPLLASDAVPISVDRLCAEIAHALPADGILVADSGPASRWTATLVGLNGRQTYLCAAALPGWALPAALGAKCAAPDRKVVCFAEGDAVYRHLAELETAQRSGIAVVLVVNNGGLGTDHPPGGTTGRPPDGTTGRPPDGTTGRPPDGTTGRPPDGTTGRPPDDGPPSNDFAALAQGFGLRGLRVQQPAALAQALRMALQEDAMVVLDVVTDPGAHPPQPWLPEPRD